MYRYRSGIPWRDLPERFGDFRVVHTHFRRWSKTGDWTQNKSGLSTKIHAHTDVLGNPTGFYLTDDLNGSDVLLDLSLSQTWTWLMDKACNS